MTVSGGPGVGPEGDAAGRRAVGAAGLPDGGEPGPGSSGAEAAGPGRLVRPYTITGGRARPDHDDLEVEALVLTTSTGLGALHLHLEQRAITQLCRDLVSVAEISAKVKLPLGVVRVLVGDMADQGLLQLHRPGQPGGRPDLALLERVLDRLRAI